MDEIERIFSDFSIDPYLLYDALVKSTDDYIYIVDMARDQALVSENMARDFDLPGRLVPGLVPLWGTLIHEKDREEYNDSIDRMLSGETDEHNVEYQIRNRKNEYIWVVCRGRLKRDGQGRPALFAGIVTNLGDKGKVDRTTGLFTQQECEKRVEWILHQLECGDTGGIMLLGLDDFTRINDLKDHIFGDGVLRKTAQEIQRALPPGAEIFRFDGDELAIVCQQGGVETLLDVYQHLHVYCNRRQELDGVSYFCTLSAGLVQMGRDGDNYLDLIKCADCALEASKRKGKNNCTVFSPGLIQARLRSQELADQLQRAVSNGMERFSLDFQPLARAGGLEIEGAEALLRWSCQQFGQVSPVEFIPILESSGLILPVGRWVLEEAVKTCREWVEYCPGFVMNVNISYLQMVDKTFLPFVRRLLAEYELEPQHLVLELTESYFVTNLEALREVFQTLRGLHVRIAMDDFGAGYSSLGMLAQSPADEVKIDRAFISAIQDNAFNRAFIGAVIQLCHSVGIRVCVEGVERSEELQAVCDLQADTIQGFYISRPISADEFKRRHWAA